MTFGPHCGHRTALWPSASVRLDTLIRGAMAVAIVWPGRNHHDVAVISTLSCGFPRTAGRSATLSALTLLDAGFGRATVTTAETETTTVEATAPAARIAMLAEREEARLAAATPGSGALHERALRTM